MIKRISRVEKDRTLVLFQILIASVTSAVIGCVIGYYLIF